MDYSTFGNLQDQEHLRLVSAASKRAIALSAGNEFRLVLINPDTAHLLITSEFCVLLDLWLM